MTGPSTSTEGAAGSSVADGRVAGSFRDPAGFVFRRDGTLFRQVNRVHAEAYERLRTSGLADELIGSSLLVPHEEVDVEPADPAEAYRVIRPELVPFVSYPYEWSFSQLRDAALLTLRIQSAALDRGMSLRDASAYNVQFRGSRPVFIDTLSFEDAVEGRPWVAYRQFCQHFLAPLALMSYRDARLGQLARVHLDGVPLDLAASLLPARARTRPGLLLHLVSHAKSQRKHAADAERPEGRAATMSERALRGLLDSLRGAIEGLSLPSDEGSTWSGYYEGAGHYDDEAMAAKERIVGSFLDELAPATVWDLGANVGRFSKVAVARGATTVAFDVDHAVVDATYREAHEAGDDRLLPLVLDLANPSPAIGWANAERQTLAERGPADAVLALALVHHLAIGDNAPLTAVVDLLADLGRAVVVEFVPKEDVMVRRLLATREDVFPGYAVEPFERAFGQRFDVLHREPLPGSPRILYLGRRR